MMAHDLISGMESTDMSTMPFNEGSTALPWDYSRCRLVGSDTIRILELFAAEDSQERLVVDIHVKSEEQLQSIDYRALSYCWGPPEFTHSIYIGTEEGFELRITRNLDMALRTVRSRILTGKSLFIWIDAICINQRDNIEKKQQLPKMSSIYSNARVICFIGLDNELAAHVLPFVRTFSRHAIRFMKAFFKAVFDNNQDLKVHMLRRIEREVRMDSKPIMSTTLNILSRPYFDRIWCLPEVFRLAGITRDAPAAEIWFADQTLTMTELFVIAIHVDQSLLTAPYDPFRQFWIERRENAEPFYSISNDKQEMFRLSTLLKSTSRYRSTVPRDRIYALLSLLPKELKDSLPAATWNKNERTDQEVCIEYSRAMIRQERRLSSLQTMRPDLRSMADRTGLPSWAIDLSIAHPEDVPLETSGSFPGTKTRFVYSASKDSVYQEPWSVWFSFLFWYWISWFMHPIYSSSKGSVYQELLCRPILRLKAQSLGTVRNCVLIDRSPGVANTVWRNPTSRAELLGSLSEIAALLHIDMQNANHETLATLVRTLCIDQHMGKSAFETFYPTAVANARDAGASVQEETLPLEFLRALYNEYFGLALATAPDIYPSSDLANLLQRLEGPMVQMCLRKMQVFRYLFVTTGGHVGVTQALLQEGDEVQLVPGSTTPLLFRKMPRSDGGMTYLGDAFVDGVMHGEAYDPALLQGIAIH